MHNFAIVMNDYSKTARQQQLRKILAEQGVGDQNHLLRELKKQGIDATQATISRDIQEMGFVKIRVGPGVYRYELLETVSGELVMTRLRILFQNFVMGVRGTDNLVLIKTSPGTANGVASLIDSLDRAEILGTIAGDDTILVVVDGKNHRQAIEKEFRGLPGRQE